MADLSDAWRNCWTSSTLKNIFRYCVLGSILILLAVLGNSFNFAPTIQLKRLYVPALDKSLNSSTNSTIDFTLSFKRDPFCSVSYFDPINVSFYDGPNMNHSIANFTIPHLNLDEEDIDKVDYSGMANATGLDLDGAKKQIVTDGFKVLRMNLTTSVRYDYYVFWKTERYAYSKSVDVKIGDTGLAQKIEDTFVGIRVMIMINLIVAVFLCSYY